MTNEERIDFANRLGEAALSVCRSLQPGAITLATSASLKGMEDIFVGMDAGRNVVDGDRNLILGTGAGRRLRRGCDNILIGDDAETPAADTCGFANIAGMCWWRETGEPAECPPPYDEGEALL